MRCHTLPNAVAKGIDPEGCIELTLKKNDQEPDSNQAGDVPRMSLKFLASLPCELSIPKFSLESTVSSSLLEGCCDTKGRYLYHASSGSGYESTSEPICRFVPVPTWRATDILFSRKTCSTNSFPTCVIKQKQLCFIHH